MTPTQPSLEAQDENNGSNGSGGQNESDAGICRICGMVLQTTYHEARIHVPAPDLPTKTWPEGSTARVLTLSICPDCYHRGVATLRKRAMPQPDEQGAPSP